MLKNILIIFGGNSVEHEVSVMSAKHIYKFIDKQKYFPILVGISKAGVWYLLKDIDHFYGLTTVNDLNGSAQIPVHLIFDGSKPKVISYDTDEYFTIDLAFPIMHGRIGEDGCIQGLCKVYNLPCVGSGVLGAAIGMDKDIAKRLLLQSGIRVAKFQTVDFPGQFSWEDLRATLGDVMFVKPACSGSSIGTSKVTNAVEFAKSLDEAFLIDNKVIVEEFIDAVELECAVLGNRHNREGGIYQKPTASVVGAIIPNGCMYSYDDKYFNKSGAHVQIPADLSCDQIAYVQELAVKVFIVLQANGLARVDFFFDKNTQEIIVNEINTMPGFTNLSMYPQLITGHGVTGHEGGAGHRVDGQSWNIPISYEQMINLIIEASL